MVEQIRRMTYRWLTRSWGLFVILVGAAAIAIDFYSNLSLQTSLIALVAVAAIAVALAAIAVTVEMYRRRESGQIDFDPESLGAFSTPNEADFDDIYQLDRDAFQANELIPAATFRSWFRANRRTFFVLRVDDKIVGYFSILPLKSSTLDRFIKGEICESDFTERDILTEHHARRASRIYLFSVVIHPAYRRRYATQLAQRLLDERDNPSIFPAARLVYAAAATKAGRRWLQRFDFVKKGNGTTRADGHDLYACQIGMR